MTLSEKPLTHSQSCCPYFWKALIPILENYLRRILDSRIYALNFFLDVNTVTPMRHPTAILLQCIQKQWLKCENSQNTQISLFVNSRISFLILKIFESWKSDLPIFWKSENSKIFKWIMPLNLNDFWRTHKILAYQNLSKNYHSWISKILSLELNFNLDSQKSQSHGFLKKRSWFCLTFLRSLCVWGYSDVVWGSCARSAGYQEGRRGPVIVNASPNFAHEGGLKHHHKEDQTFHFRFSLQPRQLSLLFMNIFVAHFMGKFHTFLLGHSIDTLIQPFQSETLNRLGCPKQCSSLPLVCWIAWVCIRSGHKLNSILLGFHNQGSA